MPKCGFGSSLSATMSTNKIHNWQSTYQVIRTNVLLTEEGRYIRDRDGLSVSEEEGRVSSFQGVLKRNYFS